MEPAGAWCWQVFCGENIASLLLETAERETVVTNGQATRRGDP